MADVSNQPLILISKDRALVLLYSPPIFKPFDKIMECGSSVTHPLSSFLCFSWVILSMLSIYISPASLSLVFMAMETMMA